MFMLFWLYFQCFGSEFILLSENEQLQKIKSIMFDNFIEENPYHSSDQVFTHPITKNRIFIGDIQAALDFDQLKANTIKTGSLTIIQSLQRPRIWTMSDTSRLSCTLSILYSMEKTRISLLFLMLSLISQKPILKEVTFLFIVLQAFQGYYVRHLEQYSSYFLFDEV